MEWLRRQRAPPAIYDRLPSSRAGDGPSTQPTGASLADDHDAPTRTQTRSSDVSSLTSNPALAEQSQGSVSPMSCEISPLTSHPLFRGRSIKAMMSGALPPPAQPPLPTRVTELRDATDGEGQTAQAGDVSPVTSFAGTLKGDMRAIINTFSQQTTLEDDFANRLSGATLDGDGYQQLDTADPDNTPQQHETDQRGKVPASKGAAVQICESPTRKSEPGWDLPPAMWNPVWLRLPVLIALLFAFTVVAIATGLLYHVSRIRSGLSRQEEAAHYAWKYGPTIGTLALTRFSFGL